MTDAVPERYKEALRNGHLAVVSGRPREALEHYEEASRLVGHRALPHVSRGGVLLQMRRPQDALLAFEEALRRDPRDVSAMRGKLHALQASGRHAEASALAAQLSEQEFAGLQDGRPGGASGSAERRFAEAHARLAMGDVSGAIGGLLAASMEFMDANAMGASLDACYRALEIAPGSPEVHLAMVSLYLRRGWRDLAVERVALLERLIPFAGDPRAQAALATMLREHRARHPELVSPAPPP
jgi:tetratricopeptide (TPR) repeat protein